MHKLTRLYEKIDTDVLDSARHVVEDGWLGGSKIKLTNFF